MIDVLSAEAHPNLSAFEASLPPAPKPVASYVTAIRTGNLLYTAGALPMQDGKVQYTGAMGGFTTSLEQGQAAARLCVTNLLSILKDQLGSLHQVERIIKLTGFVNARPDFTQHPQIVNGASDYLVEIFGERGKHARSAVGVASLPLDATVEIELIVEVKA